MQTVRDDQGNQLKVGRGHRARQAFKTKRPLPRRLMFGGLEERGDALAHLSAQSQVAVGMKTLGIEESVNAIVDALRWFVDQAHSGRRWQAKTQVEA